MCASRVKGIYSRQLRKSTGCLLWLARMCAQAFSVLLLVSFASAKDGKPVADRDLTQSSLEELMNIDVSSVSRKDQKLSKVAAAVYVVTADDIRRSGASSIPEALRMVPGVQVARIDSSKWAVSCRGFSGRFANKMLVLIDGRSIYNDLYGGVEWDQYDLPMEDIERIEVIRGPGGTMWGANAVNGVINIITRRAKDTHGPMVSVGTGSEDLTDNTVRYGGARGDSLNYRAWAKQFSRNHMLTSQGGDARDSWNRTRGGARVDYDLSAKDSLVFDGDLYQGSSGQRIYSSFPIQDPRSAIEDRSYSSGGYVLGRWDHKATSDKETVLQVYYNEENRREAPAELRLKTLDFDFQQRLPASKWHDLMWGLGYRSYWDQEAPGRIASFDPSNRRDDLYSSFVQDDIALIPDRLVFSAGVKLQHNGFTGLEVQPNARLFWELKHNHAVWGAVSRAVRTPNTRDVDVIMHFGLPAQGPLPMYGLMVGNKQSISENLVAYEAGYRTQLGNLVAIDLSLFVNNYRNLQNFQAGTPQVVMTASPYILVPITFVNTGTAHSRGVELAATWNLAPKWKIESNYSWMHTRSDLDPHNQLGAMGLQPGFDQIYRKHQLSVRSSFDLTRRLSLDVTAYYMGAMQALSVPAYTRLDMRVGWRASERSEISIGVQNMLEPRHQEFAVADYVVASPVSRSIYARLTWGN